MPVRKIPKSFRSVTGRFPSQLNNDRCIGCESRLEQEYYLRLEFDRTVRKYEEQPLVIKGEVDGKNLSYTPDCLINYSDGKPDKLVEVKFQSELDENKNNLAERLSLARIYAAEKGIEFEVVTEADIRDAALDNYRLIYRFRKPPNNLKLHKEVILNSLSSTHDMTLQDLMQALSNDRLVQASFKSTLWHLIFTGDIVTDLNRKIDNSTRLRIRNG